MKKLLSGVLGIVIASSMLTTASFAEGLSNGTQSFLSFGENTNETKLTAAGWTYENFQKASEGLNYAAKFQGGSPAGSITYSNLTGLAAGESLTFSAEIRMNDTSKSKFMITFTDSDGDSSYIFAGDKQADGNDLWTMSHKQKVDTRSNKIGSFGFEKEKWSEKYTVRMKSTNTIDVLKGDEFVCRNVVIPTVDTNKFEAAKLKSITIGAYGSNNQNVTCIKNVSVTKEPCTEGRPDVLSAAYTNDFENYKGTGTLPDGFSNLNSGDFSGPAAESDDAAQGTSLKLTANKTAQLVFAKPVKSGVLMITWKEKANTSGKPKFYVSSNETDQSTLSVEKILNGISTGSYNSSDVVREWVDVTFKIDFTSKEVVLLYGAQGRRVYIMDTGNDVLTNGALMLTFANGDAGSVCYDNLKIVHTGAEPEEPVFNVNSINKTNLRNVEINYTNTTDEDKSGIAVAAYYRNGVLVNCEIKNVILSKDAENGTANVEFTQFDTSKYDKSNVFLWNGTNNITPLF